MTILPLLTALALSQGLTTLAPGATGGGKVLASFGFATPGCYASGTGGVSITRAGVATRTAADGYTVTSCAANEYRVDSVGLVVESAAKNYAYPTQISVGTAVQAGWILQAGATVATDATEGVGGSLWTKITSSVADKHVYGTPTTDATLGFVASVWARTAAATGTAVVYTGCKNGGATVTSCACARSSGGSCSAVISTDCLATFTGLTTTPDRLSVRVACSASTTLSVLGMLPAALGGTGTMWFAAPQVELSDGVTGPSSFLPTTAAAGTRAADQVSVTIPALPSSWCISATATRTDFVTWGLSDRLWSLGTSGANTAFLDQGASFRVDDASLGVRYSVTAVPPTTGAVRLVACDNLGAMSLTIGSTSSPYSGAGTGILTTPPTTLYLGGASASLYGNVRLSNVKVCSAKGPGGCK
jgi:hypothetical protein